jgi:sec-independent protein translocase protein TatB
MFDLSWSHILLVLIVALVVVGPKDLPKLMRTAGQWTAKARAMADQFRKSFDEMARQSELEELRAEIESLRHERPLAEIDQALQQPVMLPTAVPVAVETPPPGIVEHPAPEPPQPVPSEPMR